MMKNNDKEVKKRKHRKLYIFFDILILGVFFPLIMVNMAMLIFKRYYAIFEAAMKNETVMEIYSETPIGQAGVELKDEIIIMSIFGCISCFIFFWRIFAILQKNK